MSKNTRTFTTYCASPRSIEEIGLINRTHERSLSSNDSGRNVQIPYSEMGLEMDFPAVHCGLWQDQNLSQGLR